MKQEQRALKARIEDLVRQYYEDFHRTKPFEEGDRIPYSGRVYDAEEMVNLVDAALEFWLTAGHYAEEFEAGLADYLGVRHCSLVNSGSSANLCAFMALTSPKLGERRIKKGDEVITAAAAFPTTVAPIVQYGAVPVFLDVTIPEYNIDVRRLEEARTEKTKAVFAAHTLGNPFDLRAVREFCDRYGLWLIEDNCDALGSRCLYGGGWRLTGTVGDLSTYSFYPPHHITLGEGGAVCTNSTELCRLVNSFRDWGRDCWCASGVDGTCGRRFTQQFGELPLGYDHKYVYSHFGYNLKSTDMQAAVGCAQLKKLPGFVEARKRNWARLREGLADTAPWLILPERAEDADPSWFGFLMTVREDAGFTRDGIVRFLEGRGIQTRNLFSGNFIKHPCFDEMRRSGGGYRIVGDLGNTDAVMNRTFWIGVYPGMDQARLDYMVRAIHEFLAQAAEKGRQEGRGRCGAN